jgi:hypothetical protein
MASFTPNEDGTGVVCMDNNSEFIRKDSQHAQAPVDADEDGSELAPDAHKALLEYLANNVEEFRHLRDLRKKVKTSHLMSRPL